MTTVTIQIRGFVVGGTYKIQGSSLTMKRLAAAFNGVADRGDDESIIFFDENEISITKE
jgi:hypothetical protein